MAYKVYISSTREDLVEYRAAVQDVVIRMGMLPVMEDDLGLAPNPQLMAYLKKQLMESHVFIGIYAYHYGYSDDERGISVEEQEFEWAVQAGIHAMFFVIHPDAPWSIRFIDRDQNGVKVQALKERVAQQKIVNPFRNMHELQTLTFLGLHQALQLLHMQEGVMSLRSVFGAPLNDNQFQADIFMIMPFREKFEPIYRNVIIPMAQEDGLSIKRGDDYFSEYPIVREIWSAIYNAKLFIAELTDQNANVFYELGIAHTIGKPGIMITQRIEDIPFDIRHLRYIVYEDTPDGLKRLKDQLASACQLIMMEGHS